ncbi:MAG TPA: MJ0042-type zinc finger domain-containing protein [Gemmataceae bacterium]|nr:MJ0042-type zinc finger domain-containing protein [Gemmataceae bacterium]
MNLTISCPACQRPLRVPERLLGQAVKCPSCSHTFTAPESVEEPPRRPSAPPPDDYDDKPHASKRRVPDDDNNEDHDDERPHSRRLRDKPGKVQAIAIMMLIGGILATLHAACVLAYFGFIGVLSMGIGLLCCLWPGPYYGLVMGIMAITKGTRLLGEKAHRETPPYGIANMMIINIINLDIVNLTLGIIVLVFLVDEEVKDYFSR